MDETIKQLNAYLTSGDQNQLEELAQKVVSEQPENSLGYYFLAEANAMKPNYPNAELCLAKAIELDNNVSYKLRFATLKEMQGEFDNARLVYDKILMDDATNYHALLGMGHYYMNEGGDFTAAAETYTQAIEASDDKSDALIYRANAYLMLDKYEEALADADEADGGSFDESIELIRSQCYSGLSKSSELTGSLSKLASNITDNFFYAMNYANNLFSNEDYDKAEGYYNSAIKLDEANGGFTPAVYSMLANNQLSKKDYKSAKATLDTLIEKVSDDDSYYLMRVEANLGIKDNEGALSDVSKALEFVSDGGKEEVLLKKGHVLIDMEKFSEAESIFQELGKDPVYENDSNYGLGLVYHGLGDKDKCFDYIDKAVKGAHKGAKKFLRTMMSAELKEAAKELEGKYEGEFSKNAASSLGAYTGKIYGYDKSSAKFPSSLPKAFVEAMIKELSKSYVIISEKAVMIANTSDYTVGYYKIESDNKKEVVFEIAPTNGNSPMHAKVEIKGKDSISFGFKGSKKEAPVFKSIPVNKLSKDNIKDLQNFIQPLDFDVLGDSLSELKKSFF